MGPWRSSSAEFTLTWSLIEQREFRSAVSDLQGNILKARSFKRSCGSMYRLDGVVGSVIWRSSGFERLLEFI
jgi:hypothetical protein